MPSISEQKAIQRKILDDLKNKPGALFGGYFINKDLEQLETPGAGFTVNAAGQVNLKNTGYGAAGGLTTPEKQQAAEAINEINRLDAINRDAAGRSIEELTKLAGGTLNKDNLPSAIRKYDKKEGEGERDELRKFEARLRKEASLEAEKIRAESRLDNTEARMFEQQMRNADRALEREMRMFEMEEKNKGRKAELFQALFGLGTAFMI